MSDPDFLARSKDVGAQAAQRTQELMEQIAAQLTRASEQFNRDAEAQARQGQDLIQELFERGRAATERLIDTVEAELRTQLDRVRADLARLERRLGQVAASRSGGATMKASAPASKRPAKKASPKQATAKKSTTKATKKGASKKASAKKTTAKKSPAKKSAKKSTKKAAAKRAAASSSSR